jgi:hypothetical protein
VHTSERPRKSLLRGPGPGAGVLDAAERVGLAYALRTAPTPAAALEGAALVLEHRLVGDSTASSRLTVAAMLEAIEQLDAGRRSDLLVDAGIEDGRTLLTRLDSAARARLAAALRAGLS